MNEDVHTVLKGYTNNMKSNRELFIEINTLWASLATVLALNDAQHLSLTVDEVFQLEKAQEAINGHREALRPYYVED